MTAPSKSKAKPIRVRADRPSQPSTPARTLAKNGDPYVTANGKIIQPKSFDGKDDPIKKAKIKSYKPEKKRTLKDLPAQPGVLRGVACVFVYTMLGLSDREIAESLGINLGEVRLVRENAAYAEVFDVMSSEFINANSKLLQARLASYAEDALTNVYGLAMGAAKDEVKLRANIDLLDRGNIRPKDNDARDRQQVNELRITVIKQGDADIEINGISVGGV